MNKIFSEKTANCMFLKIAIEDALVAIKSFMSNNKKMSDELFANAIKVAKDFRHEKNPYYQMDIRNIRKAFNAFGIISGNDLVNALIEYKNEINAEKNSLLLTGIKKIKMPKSDGNKKEFKSYKHCAGLDPERTLAIRSQHGEYDVLFYKFTGMIGKNSVHQLNLLKMQYHFDTGCPYYQARPILLSTWQTLNNDHKQASSPA